MSGIEEELSVRLVQAGYAAGQRAALRQAAQWFRSDARWQLSGLASDAADELDAMAKTVKDP